MTTAGMPDGVRPCCSSSYRLQVAASCSSCQLGTRPCHQQPKNCLQLPHNRTHHNSSSGFRHLPRNKVLSICSGGVHLDTSSSSGAAVLNGSSAAQPGLIFSSGQLGAWDEAGVGSPVVRCYISDNEQRWYMWYTGRSSSCQDVDAFQPSSGCVGVAVSGDGVNWLRGRGAVEGQRGDSQADDVGKILGPSQDWWTLDTCHLTASDVQCLSSDAVNTGVGVYWMFYSGGSFEPVAVPAGFADMPGGAEVEGLRMRPGLAMSQDGRNWARIEGEHHTGALFDVGKPGQWDEIFIGSPQVVSAGPGDMRMYYHSFDTRRQKYVVGLAVSPDGFRWTKRGPIFDGGHSPSDFDARGVAARHVQFDVAARRYVMFYEAVAQDDRRSIGIAVSNDGVKDWRRLSRAVLEASSEPGSWDDGGVGTPCAVPMAGGRYRLYYAGRQSGCGSAWTGIGMALSVEGEDQFEGIPGSFQRRSGSKGSSAG